jgi:hypothetical protein
MKKKTAKNIHVLIGFPYPYMVASEVRHRLEKKYEELELLEKAAKVKDPKAKALPKKLVQKRAKLDKARKSWRKKHLADLLMGTRIFSLHQTKEDAVTVIKACPRNGLDEGAYYSYMAIEEVPMGQMPLAESIAWYELTPKGKYRKCEHPECLERVFGFVC